MSVSMNIKQHDSQLRGAAEAHMADAPQAGSPARSREELWHELQVYQIELEMQNEALSEAKIALEESRDRYIDLYEFAPVGYLTLTADGTVAEINLTGCTLLGVERKNLLNRHFTLFVAPEDQDRWSRHFLSLKKQTGQGKLELTLKRGTLQRGTLQRGEDTVFHAQLEFTPPAVHGSPASSPSPLIRMALSDISERKQVEAERIENLAQLRQLSQFLQQVREQDRAHFSRELHDELGQNLTALRIDFNSLTNDLASENPAILTRLAAIDQMLLGTVDSVRRICEDLRPAMLDALGLEAALTSYVKNVAGQYGLACDLELDREDYRLDEPTSTAIFRIVQESLTNIGRHAHASHVMVALQCRGDHLLLTIADDGCGLPAAICGERKCHGLLGMRERVNMLGGSIAIDSAPGRGTHIEVIIPGSQGLAS
ncbi:ATP-binding protein [Propionivibrio sp.]|uniref:sensor histidine kinase n=1 Tax=Propionivibrio sp. TaxID=2212460 RepID=UPI003BF3F744